MYADTELSAGTQFNQIYVLYYTKWMRKNVHIYVHSKSFTYQYARMEFSLELELITDCKRKSGRLKGYKIID